jgi:hypothetical protein
LVSKPTPIVEAHIDIVRLGPGATKVVLSVADNYVGVQSHWTGRTLLCPGTAECPGCLAGLETRWLGYLPIVHNRNVYALLEISAQAARAFDEARDGGSLFNVGIELRKGRRFEPIKVVRTKAGAGSGGVPLSPHTVIDQLARILGLPRLRPGEAIEQWEERLQTVAAARLAMAVRARG